MYQEAISSRSGGSGLDVNSTTYLGTDITSATGYDYYIMQTFYVGSRYASSGVTVDGGEVLSGDLAKYTMNIGGSRNITEGVFWVKADKNTTISINKIDCDKINVFGVS